MMDKAMLLQTYSIPFHQLLHEEQGQANNGPEADDPAGLRSVHRGNCRETSARWAVRWEQHRY